MAWKMVARKQKEKSTLINAIVSFSLSSFIHSCMYCCYLEFANTVCTSRVRSIYDGCKTKKKKKKSTLTPPFRPSFLHR